MSHTPLLPICKADLHELCNTTAYSANQVLFALSNPWRAPAAVVERVTRARRLQLEARATQSVANPRFRRAARR